MEEYDSEPEKKYYPEPYRDLSLITEEEWPRIIKKLYDVARGRFRWYECRYGISLKDEISAAITDTLRGAKSVMSGATGKLPDGERRWPPIDPKTGEEKPIIDSNTGEEKQIDLLSFLCKIVESKVSHELNKAKRRCTLREDEEHDEVFQWDLLVEQSRKNRPDFYPPHENTQMSLEVERFVRKMKEVLCHDDLALKLFNLLLHDPRLTRAERIAALGITEADHDNAWRRLMRKVEKVKEEGVYV